MFIRSTLLITLVSVGVAGCQDKRGISSVPMTTASLSEASDSEIPAPIPTATPMRVASAKTLAAMSYSSSDIPAPIPTTTASAPTLEPEPIPAAAPMEVSEEELQNLKVQAYPETIPAPAPEMAQVVSTPTQRRGLLSPLRSVMNRMAPSSLDGNRHNTTGRTYKFGRRVIASRSSAKTQRIIIEDDLTDDNYALDTGDRIRLSVFEQRNLSRIYTIDAGGFISVPLIGNISVRGETTSAVEQIIAERLSQKYIKDPKVSVEINTYRPFYILGQVRNSGSFPFVNGMTVRSAVAIAGGYTARANKRKVMLTRRLNKKRITTYVQPGYYIRPGDTLEIRERFF